MPENAIGSRGVRLPIVALVLTRRAAAPPLPPPPTQPELPRLNEAGEFCMISENLSINSKFILRFCALSKT